jgi:nucleoside-diphosphate-sugar epimerase
MTDKAESALVLGATGGIGGAVTRALMRRGWTVKALVRDQNKAQREWQQGTPTPHWITGDAMKRADVEAAAAGAGMIFHGVNPPGYRNWDKVVLPMIDNTIHAARSSGARIVLPGTVYNFDPRKVDWVDERSEQNPRSRKGQVRKELEARLEHAGVPVLILRAGDFFGADARQSWFTQLMAPAGKPLKRILNPATAPHSWAYLPDLAEAFARLMELDAALRPFERVQFAGYVDADGRSMAALIQQAADDPRLPIWRFPWWSLGLAAPFGGFPREAWEIRDHWRYPMQFDNARLLQLIGEEPHTAPLQAVRATLEGTGVLAASRSQSRAVASTMASPTRLGPGK